MTKLKRKQRMRRKSRLFRRPAPGTAPGTVSVHPDAPRPKIRVIAYGPAELADERIDDLGEIPTFLDRWPVTWVNVDGLGDVATLERLGELFGLHRLALEDVANVHQRAKVEAYAEDLFVVARMVSLGDRLQHEQVSIFLGEGFVLTFQEHEGDCFEPIRKRLRSGRGRIRSAGADYLMYALLDAIMDSYFPVLEHYGERLADLETEALTAPQNSTVIRIQDLKHDLLALRRTTWPHRDAVGHLLREDTPLVTDETRLFLRDVYDHCVQLMDLIENFREVGSGLIDLYLSSMSHRMNDVMKVLTIIATIFIPLSFIAGLYGMNFSPEASPWNMPELGWYWGYPFALGLMGLAALVMLIYFRRKGWLEKTETRQLSDAEEAPPGVGTSPEGFDG
jgi:magnesium transporter